MGDPRRLKSQFKRPRTPFETSRLESELRYLGDYGLRNKRELWRHKYQLSKFRKQARDLKTMPEDLQEIVYAELVGKLSRLGLIGLDATTDDILSLNIDDILNRRLQTIVYKKGLARTIYQARQLVVHKHIKVGEKVIASPSYLVLKNEEDGIQFRDVSPLSGNPDKLFGQTKKADAPAKKSSRRKRKSSKKKSRRKN